MTLRTHRPVSGALRRLRAAAPAAVIQRWVRALRCLEEHPPYDPRAAAERLGLRVEFQSVEAAGLLDTDEANQARILIGLGADRSPPTKERQTFLVAHELGHFVLRRELGPHVAPGFFATESADEEWLCNLFAREFLMPADTFGVRLRRDPGDPELLIGLSRLHGVSLQAGLVRAAELMRLSHKPFVAVLWSSSGEHFTKKWSVPSTGVSFQGNTSIIEAAANSDNETSGYRLLSLQGRSRRLWCRTVSRTREELRPMHSKYQEEFLTICTDR